jgi:integrase
MLAPPNGQLVRLADDHFSASRAGSSALFEAQAQVDSNSCKSDIDKDNVGTATPEQRAMKGRKSMARRSGQYGYLEEKGKSWYVRFWIDVPGQEKRAHRSVRICPVKGPGALAKPERERRAKEVIFASGADSVEHFERVQAFNQGTTFRQQSAWWMNHAQTRKRCPIKPATAVGYQSYLDKWLNPNLGDVPLSQVDNKSLRDFVEKLAAAKLAPKTIVEIVAVAKMVVASARDDNGKQLHPREWNHEYIDLPVVKSKDQNTPTVHAGEVSDILSKAGGRYRMLYALLAGTGLRIGEALAIRIEDYSEDHTTISLDCKTIHVRKSVWRGKEQAPKTDNAVRDIDVHPSLAAMLKEFIGSRAAGWLFQTKAERPLSQRNVMRDSLHKLGVRGFHPFRRFRVTHLRDQGTPEDILRFWIGHADQSVTDRYNKMSKRIQSRQQWAEKAELGFNLPAFCTKCTKERVIPIQENAA